MKNLAKSLGFIVLTAIIGLTLLSCPEPDDNTLTGIISITGAAQVGQTLTADTSDLGGSGIITFQWMRGGNTVIGTNNSAYVAHNDDVGKAITVTVTRSDNTGSITSDPTAEVSAGIPVLTGTVSITGIAQVGQTLTADTSALGGSGNISYQWKRGETTIGINRTYKVQPADEGYTINVTVTRTGNSGSVTSNSTLEVPPYLKGTVSITGMALVGQTLTANISDLGGSGAISYQWKHDDEIITGNNSNTYNITADDIGYSISVTVTRSGFTGSVTSEPTAIVTDPTLPVLTGTVNIIGTAKDGQTLTADTSSLNGSGVLSYQWKRDNTVIGYNSNSYNLTTDDIGYSITVIVTRSGNSGSITSNPTSVVIGYLYFWLITLIDNSMAYFVSGCEKNVSEVVIPAVFNGLAVTGIGGYAFYNCTSLTSITIPDNVTSIGDSAFTGCSSLMSITIPDNVTSIGDSAFAGCSSLTSITIPDSVTSIGGGAFYGCTGLTSITIPFVGATLNGTPYTTHFGYIFNNIPPVSLKTVVITGGIIFFQSFYNCSSLTNVIIGNNVTSIDESAFYNCTGLTNVTVGNNVTSIVGGMFYNCSSLTNVIIGNNVTSIGGYAFYGCTGLTSVTIPDSVASIGDSAFAGCSSLTSITIPFVGATLNGTSNTNFSYIFDYDYWTLVSPVSLKTVIITGGNSIGNSAFLDCSSLTSITIPDSVTSIGGGAFYGCTGLTSITIPDSVISIGSSAFKGCTGLTSITIPDSVTSIGRGAFEGCTGLTNVTIGNSVTSIGEGAFFNCISLTSVIIPDSVTSIDEGAFRGCSNLTSVTIGNSVTSIGNRAFDGCTNLSITWSYNPALSAGNFRDYLRTVIIPDSVTSIGDYVFQNCSRLMSITIPAGVTSIGYYAFYDCRSLTSITIPDSVTSIGDSAFNNCSSLTSITIPAGVTSIGNRTFYDCRSLTNVTIPDSVTSIGYYAFYDCRSLTSITIPDSVTSIGGYAFYACSSLTSVTIGTITSENFSTDYPFSGNLRNVYFAAGEGAGTYTRAAGSSSWVKM